MGAPLTQVFALNFLLPASGGILIFQRNTQMNIHFADVDLWVEYVSASAHYYRDAVGLNIIPHLAGERPHLIWTAVI